MMEVLFVYYSKEGHTRKICHILQQLMSNQEVSYSTVVLSETAEHPKSVLESMTHLLKSGVRHSEETVQDISKYDMVVVISPVHWWTMAKPVREFLNEHGRRMRKVAFAVCLGGRGDTSCFNEMSKFVPGKILEKDIETISFFEWEHENEDELRAKCAMFVERLLRRIGLLQSWQELDAELKKIEEEEAERKEAGREAEEKELHRIEEEARARGTPLREMEWIID